MFAIIKDLLLKNNNLRISIDIESLMHSIKKIPFREITLPAEWH